MTHSPRHLPVVTAPPEGDASGACEVDLLQVGDLAKAAGKTVRAIHLYEELGLLAPHARSKGRYRLFGADALVRVRWIGKLQELGLSLPDIQGIVREWEAQPSAPSAMRLMRDTYVAKLEETRRQIERLRTLERELDASLAYLDTCDTCDPVRLLAACGSCDLHACHPQTPDLIAGFRTSSPPTALAPAPAPPASPAAET